MLDGISNIVDPRGRTEIWKRNREGEHSRTSTERPENKSDSAGNGVNEDNDLVAVVL